jgi:hypothetical protein
MLPKNRKKLAGGSGIKTRGKSSKIWKCYTTIDLILCRNTLCETPVYTLTHVALLTEPEDRKCAYGAIIVIIYFLETTECGAPASQWTVVEPEIEKLPLWAEVDGSQNLPRNPVKTRKSTVIRFWLPSTSAQSGNFSISGSTTVHCEAGAPHSVVSRK